MRPNFSYFNDKDSAVVLDEWDFNNANVKLPAIEHLSYENGRLRGKDEGWGDGFDDGKKRAQSGKRRVRDNISLQRLRQAHNHETWK